MASACARTGSHPQDRRHLWRFGVRSGFMLASRPLTRSWIPRLSARLDARWLVVALGAFLPALVPPVGASAAPQPDRVVAEVLGEPQAVGVSGSVLAYGELAGNDTRKVVRDGSAPARRLSAGERGGALDVGRDRRGRPVVVFVRCGRRCDLVAFSPSAGRSRIVAKDVRGFVYDVTVGRGRIFWIAGKTVLSPALDGGLVRREAVAKGVNAIEIEPDGWTLAVVGSGPDETGNGSTALSVTRVGSGRARIRGERADENVLEAPCRIVRARLGGERLPPPRIATCGRRRDDAPLLRLLRRVGQRSRSTRLRTRPR